MTQIQRIILAALLFLALLAPSLFAEQIKQSKNVLVLYSEDTEHPAHKLTDIGIRETFRSNKLFDVQLYTEYLDMSRFRSSSHATTLVDYLSRKYAGLQIDAIITTYPAIVDLLLGEAKSAFPRTPIIASLVSSSYAEKLDKSPSRRFVTGAILGENISGILDYALRIRPGTKRVALISGAGPIDTYSEQIFRNGLKPYVGKLELIDLTKLPMEDILAKVKSLPPDTIILYSTILRDGAGMSFVPREALSQISLAANAPVFGLYDTYLGHGIVGGRLVSVERLGNEAAELTLRILGGEAPASIPFGGQQAYVNLYDGRELKRWGISETNVLHGSEIRYRQPSLWEQYSLVIIGVALIVMLELALIIGLLTNILRRRKAEAALIESETRVRLAVSSAGAGLWTLDTSTGRLWVSNKAREMMGVALDEELNSEKFLTLVHPEDRERVGLAMRQKLQLEQEGRIEYRLVLPDGNVRWIESLGSTLRKTVEDENSLTGVSVDITERKHAEEDRRQYQEKLEALVEERTASLSESEQRFRSMFENSLDGILFTTPDGQVLNANEAACEMLGRTKEELCEIGRKEVVDNTDPGVADAIGRRLREGRWKGKLNFQRGDGATFPVEVSSNIFKDEHGNDRAIVAIRDITDLEKSIEAQRKSEEKYRLIFEKSPIGIVHFDANAFVTDCNQFFLDTIGSPKEQVIGLNALTSIKDERVRMAFEEAFSGKVGRFEGEYTSVVGRKQFWLRLLSAPVSNKTGLVTGVLGIFEDISKRKQAEERLAQSEERFRKLITLAPLPLCLVNKESVIIYFNDRFSQVFGYTSNDIPTLKEWWLLAYPDSHYRRWVLETWEAALKRAAEQNTDIEPIEYKVTCKNGQVLIVQISGITIEDNFLATFRDITEYKIMEQERLEMERKLLHAQKLESLGVMAGGIAHDFNNLLQVVLGNLDLALAELPHDSKVRQSIRNAIMASERSAELSGQMLTYSGSSLYLPKDIHLDDLLNKTKSLLQSSISGNVALDFEISKTLPPIEGEPNQIQRLIYNLVVNAAEAIGDNAGDVTLRTGVIDCDEAYLSHSRLEKKPESGRFLFLEVSDTGCGMDAETQRKLFDPFFTTKFWGRGLGMAEVMGIVKGHHGAIMIDSEAGKGTTIRVLFSAPKEALASTVHLVEAVETQPAVSVRSAGRKTVLVVDDEELVRGLVIRRLDALGYDTITAGDGEEGVRVFRKRLNEIDLVLLDFAMPRMNGVEAFAELIRIKPEVKVILSSGYTDDVVMERFPGKRPAGLLHKPYKMEELKGELQRLLGNVD